MKKPVLRAGHVRHAALGLATLALHYAALDYLDGITETGVRIAVRAPDGVVMARLTPAGSLPARRSAPAPAPSVPSEMPPRPNLAGVAGGNAQIDLPTLGAGLPDPMPGHYPFMTPPSLRIEFDTTQTKAGRQLARGQASLSWNLASVGYRLQIEQRLDQVSGGSTVHRLVSSGGLDDDGIAPELMIEQDAKNAERSARFERSLGQVVLSESDTPQPMPGGTQDRASLLIQLAGVCSAQAPNFEGDVVLYVGSGLDAGPMTFRVLGREQLAGPLGMLDTFRVAQVSRPGAARLEAWLAPLHHCMPVQLRSSAPDGTVTTHLARSLVPPAD